MDGLTDRQLEILSFIIRFCAENVMPPTRADIAKHFGFGVNAADTHIRALSRKGALLLRAKVARGIRVA